MPTALLGLVVLVTAGAAALGAAGAPPGATASSACPVPAPGAHYPRDVGLGLAAAEACVRQAGDVAAPLSVPSTAAVGTVVHQWPTPGALPLRTPYVMYLFASSGPPAGPRAVLPLAVGPPVGDECQRRVVVGADGDVGPLRCPGGGVNVNAWDDYVQLRPALLSAGRRATARAAVRWFCGAGQPAEIGVTYAEMDAVAQLAAAYYGWRWPLPRAEDVTASECAAAGAPTGAP